LRKAIELDAEDAWAHIYLGTLLWLHADVQGARAEFQTAADLQPDWAVPQWSLGNLYEHALQDSEVAEDYFKQALNVEPNSEVALNCLNRLRENRNHS
jgi:tetratricopeptide (TPR) repeat protein